MTLSEQIDALQAKVADLKSSLDASRHETNEQIKARVASARAKAKAAEETVHGQADQAQTQWQSVKADTSAKMAELQGRIERKREEHDAKAAEDDAEWAEDNAAAALDYAAWAVDQAEVAVLDAADARAWADAQAALLQVLREANISKLAEQAALSRRPPPLVVIGEPEWN